MRIKLNVKAKSTWSQFDRDIAMAATVWAMEKFDLVDESAVLELKLVADEREDGCAIEMVRHERYVVRISKGRSVKKTLDTIFHEMTHIKQYFRDGFMMTVEGDKVFWKHEERDFDEEKDYWKAPWEVEARRVAKKMVKEYTK